MVSGLILAVVLIFYYDRTQPAEETFPNDTVFEEKNETDAEEMPQSILVPHCGDISYALSTHKNDFSFENPSRNVCLLRVSITRRDTSEVIYVSSLISPGKTVSDVSFYRDFKRAGDYGAMIKIDAYRPDFGAHSLVNSMVLDIVIHAA